jgi:hypothetical protein
MLQRSSESDYEPYYCLPVQYGPGGQGISYLFSNYIIMNRLAVSFLSSVMSIVYGFTRKIAMLI